MSVKETPMTVPSVHFSWTSPIASVIEAQALPKDFTSRELCQFLRLSPSTILRLRRTKGFPNPRGPNSRRLYYSKTEVLLWLLKECGILEEWDNEYIDKKNNIYLSLYTDAQDCVSSHQVASVPTTSSQDASVRVSLRQEASISEKEFLKILLTYGFDMHFFEQHLEELLPMFKEKGMDIEAIDKICYDVLNRVDLDTSRQDALLLAYFRNYKGNKKRSARKSTKKELLSVEFNSIDYGSMIEELNDYE